MSCFIFDLEEIFGLVESEDTSGVGEASFKGETRNDSRSAPAEDFRFVARGDVGVGGKEYTWLWEW